MWMFESPPLDYWKARYEFAPTRSGWTTSGWPRSASPRRLGSFVSADGLVMTNHHWAPRHASRRSHRGEGLHQDGFLRQDAGRGGQGPDLELNRPGRIEDVTDRVKRRDPGGRRRGRSRPARGDGRRSRRSAASRPACGATSSRSTRAAVSALHVKKYTDVRLVFAPENDIAFFGGDPDNFEYPRYDLDVCFFRVYEDGKPPDAEHYLKWSPAGAKEGELVFVAGQSRADQPALHRGPAGVPPRRRLPVSLDCSATARRLTDYGKRRPEQARRASRTTSSAIQNSLKACNGGLAGCATPR